MRDVIIFIGMVLITVVITALLVIPINPWRHISREQRDWIKRNTDGR